MALVFMGIDTKIRLNYPILHQHPTRQKPFILFVSVKKGFYRLIEPKSLKIFSLDRLLSLFLKL
ncbi:hypothetical protein BB456_04925 [Helicobacter pylori]|nr:hypothetical protein BB449_06620 [Helicobacter pylori]PDX28683.1 hypothetical protein BB456_04925 [Helicobacter pylori]